MKRCYVWPTPELSFVKVDHLIGSIKLIFFIFV